MLPTSPITVHHLESSRSLRILWLLEELELPYEIERYARDPATLRAPPELRALHPLGKSPVVTVGDGPVLFESGAIIEYFVEATGRLAPPPHTHARQRYRTWLHHAEGSVMPPLLVQLVLGRVRAAPLPFFVKPVARGIVDKVEAAFTGPELLLHRSHLEAVLSEHPYFVGEEFTAADIQMSYAVQALLSRGPAGEQPYTRAWLERVHQRPAYVRAVERGGRDTLIGD